jgi:predicted nucleic acid-binding protein
MIILDTNVLSASISTEKVRDVIEWMDHQPQADLWTTAISVFEIRTCIERLAVGRKRRQLERDFQKALAFDLADKVLPFDIDAAQEAGALFAKLRVMGRPVEVRDVQIAGIAIARRAAIATRNVNHFADAGVLLINPWSAA